MARSSRLIATLRSAGRAFVADTAPLIYRTERSGDPRSVRVCDEVFELVESGELACLVSSISVAELFLGAYRAGERAVAVVDALLRHPSMGVVAPTEDLARAAAWLVARGKLNRLADALVAATANDLGLPLLTADRRLARSGAVEAFLVADFA